MIMPRTRKRWIILLLLLAALVAGYFWGLAKLSQPSAVISHTAQSCQTRQTAQDDSVVYYEDWDALLVKASLEQPLYSQAGPVVCGVLAAGFSGVELKQVLTTDQDYGTISRNGITLSWFKHDQLTVMLMPTEEDK